MKVLQLVPRLPFPADDGGKIGILGIAEGYLRLGCAVHMGGFDQEHRRAAFAAGFGHRLAGYFVEDLSRFDHLRAAVYGLLSNRPFIREKYWSTGFLESLLRAVDDFEPDLVHLDHSHMGSYGLEIQHRYPGLPCIVRAHNVEHTVWDRMADAERRGLQRAALRHYAASVKRFEGELFSAMDGVLAISEVDAQRIRAIAPGARLTIMPAGYPLSSAVTLRPDASLAPRLAFVGYIDWAPNRDGVQWFVSTIWPDIRARWPDATLDVIGRNSGAPLPAAAGVRYLGFVDDLGQALASVDLAVVPLRIGGGMRVKILDFLSRGLPVVSTAVGAEGIPVEHHGQRVVELAESAGDFVAVAERLLPSLERRAALARAGRQLIEEQFDWTALVRRVLDWVGSRSADAPRRSSGG